MYWTHCSIGSHCSFTNTGVMLSFSLERVIILAALFWILWSLDKELVHMPCSNFARFFLHLKQKVKYEFKSWGPAMQIFSKQYYLQWCWHTQDKGLDNFCWGGVKVTCKICLQTHETMVDSSRRIIHNLLWKFVTWSVTKKHWSKIKKIFHLHILNEQKCTILTL